MCEERMMTSDDDCEKMTIQEFASAVRAGAYTDDDGTAYLGTEHAELEQASVGTVIAFYGSKSTRFTHVYWYSK
jgi:hypothetical protein